MGLGEGFFPEDDSLVDQIEAPKGLDSLMLVASQKYEELVASSGYSEDELFAMVSQKEPLSGLQVSHPLE